MKIEIIPILSDNYTYILTSNSGKVAVVDPGEAAPVIEALGDRDLDYVLNTHHHWDHTDGNAELLQKYPDAKHIFPKGREGEFDFDGHRAQIISTPGHTLDGVCFYFAQEQIIFTGDTLFSMGCGRLFEGTAADMWRSFEKLLALPDDVMIYPGHEYTRGNAGFCLKQDPQNEALRARIAEVKALRAAGKPTIPVSLGTEKATNVFLRAGNAEEFARLRHLKDLG